MPQSWGKNTIFFLQIYWKEIAPSVKILPKKFNFNGHILEFRLHMRKVKATSYV